MNITIPRPPAGSAMLDMNECMARLRGWLLGLNIINRDNDVVNDNLQYDSYNEYIILNTKSGLFPKAQIDSCLQRMNITIPRPPAGP